MPLPAQYIHQIPEAGDRAYRDAQQVLQLAKAHIVEKNVFVIFKNVPRDQHQIAQPCALQGVDTVAAAQQAGNGHRRPEEAVPRNDLPQGQPLDAFEPLQRCFQYCTE